MTQTASAIYENGMLRPTSLLFDLKEGQRLLITVQVVEELAPEETARRHAEFGPPYQGGRRARALPASGGPPARRLETANH